MNVSGTVILDKRHGIVIATQSNVVGSFILSKSNAVLGASQITALGAIALLKVLGITAEGTKIGGITNEAITLSKLLAATSGSRTQVVETIGLGILKSTNLQSLAICANSITLTTSRFFGTGSQISVLGNILLAEFRGIGPVAGAKIVHEGISLNQIRTISGQARATVQEALRLDALFSLYGACNCAVADEVVLSYYLSSMVAGGFSVVDQVVLERLDGMILVEQVFHRLPISGTGKMVVYRCHRCGAIRALGVPRIRGHEES